MAWQRGVAPPAAASKTAPAAGRQPGRGVGAERISLHLHRKRPEKLTPNPVRLRELLARLIEADVRFVLVGGLAVNAWGYLRATRDIDFVPDPDPENLATELGQVDVLQGLPQVPRFAVLAEKAKDVDLDGLLVRVCSLEHLIGMKRASERPRDVRISQRWRPSRRRTGRGNDFSHRYPVATRSPWSGRLRAASRLPRWKPSLRNNRPCRLRPGRPTPPSRSCRGARRCAQRSRPGGRRSGSKTSSCSPGCSSPASSTSRTRCCRGVHHLRRLLPDLQRRLLRQRPDRRRARPQAPEEALPARWPRASSRRPPRKRSPRRWRRRDRASPSPRQLAGRADGGRLRHRPGGIQPRPQADRDHRRDDAGGAVHPSRRRRGQRRRRPRFRVADPLHRLPRRLPRLHQAPPGGGLRVARGHLEPSRAWSTTRSPSSTRWSPWSPPAP